MKGKGLNMPVPIKRSFVGIQMVLLTLFVVMFTYIGLFQTEEFFFISE